MEDNQVLVAMMVMVMELGDLQDHHHQEGIQDKILQEQTSTKHLYANTKKRNRNKNKNKNELVI